MCILKSRLLLVEGPCLLQTYSSIGPPFITPPHPSLVISHVPPIARDDTSGFASPAPTFRIGNTFPSDTKGNQAREKLPILYRTTEMSSDFCKCVKV